MLAVMSSSADPSVLTVPVSTWAIEETAVRMYATTGFAQSAVEAATELAPQRDPDDIRRVLVSVSPTSRTAAGIAAPTSDEEAWWSVQHAVATVLVHGDESILQAGLQEDPRVLALLHRVEFDADRDDVGATVTVERTGGPRQTASADVPLGDPRHPASTEQLLHKWAVLAGTGGDRAWTAASRLGSKRLKAVVHEAGLARD